MRTFLALLLTVIMIAGNPALASAFMLDQGCATAAQPAGDDGGCCGGLDKPACSIACPMTSAAAAVGVVVSRFKPTTTPLLFVPATALAGLILGPPDTAPPKSPSA